MDIVNGICVIKICTSGEDIVAANEVKRAAKQQRALLQVGWQVGWVLVVMLALTAIKLVWG